MYLKAASSSLLRTIHLCFALVSIMRLNRTKCKVLHLSEGNRWYQYRLGEEGMESSPAGKSLWVLLDEEMAMSQQYALTAQRANHVLGYIQTAGPAGRGR